MSTAEYANLNVVLDNENAKENHIQLKKTFKSLIFDGNLILDAKKAPGNNYNLDHLHVFFLQLSNLFWFFQQQQGIFF